VRLPGDSRLRFGFDTLGAFALVAVSLLAHEASVSAQTSTTSGSNPNTRPAAKQGATKQKRAVAPTLRVEQRHALGVVDKIAGEARSIDDIATRVRLEARAAELLWDFDQARARVVFAKAFDEADSMIDDSSPSLFGGALRAQLLAEVLRRAYVRDTAFAETLLNSLDDSGDGIDYGTTGPMEATEQGTARLAIATSLAATNSSAAVALARSSLDDADPSELAGFLIVLRRADKSAGDALYTEAIAHLSRQSALVGDLVSLQSYAIPTIEPNAPDPWRSFGVPPTPNLAAYYLEAVWLAGQRQLVQFAGAAQNDQPATAGDLYAQFASLLPAFDQFDPARVPDVRAVLANAATSLDASERDRFDSLTRVETAQSIADRAANTPDQSTRDALYLRAATVAAASSDDFREVESYASKINNSEMRQSFLDGAGQMISRRLANRRRYDDAVRVATQVPGLDARVECHLVIAARAAETGDRSRASEVLDAAEVDAEKARPSEQSLSLARIASAYSGLDTIRGAEVMQDAVRATNVAFRLDRPDAGSNPGRAPSGRTQAVGTRACTELEVGLERIASSDYFRALMLAQSIDDKTCSMSAQLAAARGALSRAPRPAPRKSGD
jgi:hypothetical protein